MGEDVSFLASLNSSVPEDRRKIKLAIESMGESCLISAMLFRPKFVPGCIPGPKSDITSCGMCSTADDSDSHHDFVSLCQQSREKYIREIHESIAEMGYIVIPSAEEIPDNTLFRVVRFCPADFGNTMLQTDLHPRVSAAAKLECAG